MGIRVIAQVMGIGLIALLKRVTIHIYIYIYIYSGSGLRAVSARKVECVTFGCRVV